MKNLTLIVLIVTGITILTTVGCKEATKIGEELSTMPPTSEGEEVDVNNEENDQENVGTNGTSKSFCHGISEEIVTSTNSGKIITLSPSTAGYVNNGTLKTTLRAVISAAEEGSTILLADGTYTFIENGNYNGIYITKPGITIRSSSGDPEKVILDASYSDLGGETAPITVAAQSITIADITIKRSIFHLIHLWNGSDNVKIHNVHLIDGGEQFIKSSPGDTNRINGGSVTCSKFIMTPIGRQNVWGYGTQYGGTRCYTGGIDTHSTNSWQISDNYFEGIYCESSGGHPIHGKKRTDVAYVTYVGGLAEHAIHMWNSDAGTRHIIERNTIVNCARGIGLGLGSTLRIHGGIVRNNMIFSSHPGGSEHDVGIMLEGGADVQIYNNTLFFSHSNAYANAIEYRFSTTTGATISNNLTNKAIARRDSASGILTTNVTTASSSWFANLASGNLHLASCSIPELSESGSVIDTNAVDVDNELRDGLAPDIGADQCVEI